MGAVKSYVHRRDIYLLMQACEDAHPVKLVPGLFSLYYEFDKGNVVRIFGSPFSIRQPHVGLAGSIPKRVEVAVNSAALRYKDQTRKSIRYRLSEFREHLKLIFPRGRVQATA